MKSNNNKQKYDNYANEIQTINQTITEVKQNLRTETTTRQTEDNKLQTSINTINGKTIPELHTTITTEVGTKYDPQISEIKGKITSESTKLQGNINNLKTDLQTDYDTKLSELNTSINNKVYKVLNDRITNEINTVNTNYKAEDNRLQGEIDKINNTTIDKKVNDLKTTLECKYDPEISTIKQTISDNQSDIQSDYLKSIHKSKLNANSAVLTTRLLRYIDTGIEGSFHVRERRNILHDKIFHTHGTQESQLVVV